MGWKHRRRWHGTQSFISGDDDDDAWKQHELIANPERFQALRKGEQLLAAHKDHPLIRIAVAPHAPYTVSNDENWRTLREYSERLDVRIHTHVHETAKEVADSLVQFGKRPIERLAQLSIFGPRTIAVHMTQLTDDEIVLMAESKVWRRQCCVSAW